MTQLITLPDNTDQFTVNWTDATGQQQTETFYVEDKLSLERYMMFERFRIEAGMGISFPDLVKAIRSNLEFCERAFQGEKVMTQMVAMNFNLLNGINDVALKKPFAIWLCTLFFNTQNEDRRYFQDEVMRRKIQIWEDSGMDSAFFLKQALALVQNFSAISAGITGISSALNERTNSELDPPGTETQRP